jgi:hypothetical protein
MVVLIGGGFSLLVLPRECLVSDATQDKPQTNTILLSNLSISRLCFADN